MHAPLVFLPMPRRVGLREGSFVLDAATAISVPTGDEGAAHAALSLRAAIHELTGLRLEVTTGPGPISLEYGLKGTSQSYEIEINPSAVVVRAADDAGQFYGVQTLIQLAKNRGRIWPSLLIQDKPVLPNRGVMLDVSRGKVPRLETLFRLTETLAHYKFNQFQLYFEHTFAFPSHPEISAGAEPLTPEDIRALDAHSRKLHIELIPNLQSIGHQRPLLSLPEFQPLAETAWNWSFSSVSDEGFALLDELYGEMMAAFSSEKFNVNADEPWDFGRGKSRERAAEIGLGRLYLEHLKRLHALVAKRGKRMLMWADMFWHYPELVSELPEDILLLDWWYESKPAYDTVNVLKAVGREFYVCAATSSWSTLYPRMENAISNIRDFTRAGVEAGASGMMITDWGDNGHFQPYSNSMYAYLLSADAGWTGARTPLDDVDAAIGKLFLGDSSGLQIAAIRRLGAAMQVAPDWLKSWHSAMALFEDPVAGKMASLAPQSVIDEARAAAEHVQQLLADIRDPELRHDLGFVTAQIIFAAGKVETSRTIQALLRFAPADNAGAKFDEVIASLRAQAARLPAMKEEFEERWLAEGRRSEIQQNLDRFEKLAERYEYAIGWLETQKTLHGPGSAIDADLTSYDRGEYAVLHEATRNQIEELVDIIGIDEVPPDLLPWVDVPSEIHGAARAEPPYRER